MTEDFFDEELLLKESAGLEPDIQAYQQPERA